MPHDSTNSVALKPCPFCGGKAYLKHRKNWGYRGECQWCDLALPYYRRDAGMAVENWNTRIPPQVKPLVWQNNGNHWAGGHGYVVRKFGGEYTLTMRNQFDQQFFDLESAQSAAQADYTRRTLEALA